MLTNRTTKWTVAAALVSAVLVAATWFLLVGPRRSQAADLQEQTGSAQQANDVLRQRTAQLRAQLGDLPARRQELAAISRQLPKQAEMPTLVRDLRRIADSAGVSLTTVTPGEPQYLDPATGQAAAPGAAGTSPLVSIPMTVVASGDFFETALFMKQVQTQMRRTMLITGVTVDRGEQQSSTDGSTTSSDSGNGSVSLNVTGQVFVFQPGAAGATTAGAAGTASGTAATGAAASGGGTQ